MICPIHKAAVFKIGEILRYNKRGATQGDGMAQRPIDKVFVVSLPKSGTYLMAEVLSQLGYERTIHVCEDFVDRYNDDRLQEGRDRPDKFRSFISWRDALQLVGAGQFAVGHLPFSVDRQEALEDFRTIFLKRQLRDCLVSDLRWTLSTKRRERHPHASWLEGPKRTRTVEFLKDRGPIYRKHFRAMLGWNQAPNVQVYRFEDLYAGKISSLLSRGEADVASAVVSSLKRETLTKSPSRTNLSDFWSDDAEALYLQLFGDLGQLYGYSD